MPPITTNQGSRAGLITAVVIFTILFVVSTIFAIYFGVQMRTEDQLLSDQMKKYGDIVSEADLSSPDYSTLHDAKKPGQSILDVALGQRDQLAQLINGAPAGAPAAQGSASDDALTSAAKELKDSGSDINLPSPSGNLAAAVKALADGVVAQQGKIKDLNGQLADANQKLNDTLKAQAQVSAQQTKALEDVRADADAKVAAAEDDRKSKDAQVDQIEKDRADERARFQKDAQAVQVQLAEKDRQHEKDQEELAALHEKLGGRRLDTADSVVRRSAGKIIRLAGNNVCYINLGQGDQVVPGLTFEVYDKAEGIPNISEGTTDDNLPVGKGSIEITRVGASSSECRIIQQTPSTVMSEGDLLVNLIYDPNTKYNFFVYGDFDLGHSGRPSPADMEVIKRLITQWGGKVTDQINIDTDFLILGSEPQLPNFTKEELDQPLNADKLAKAQAALDKYNEIRNEARDLHIPILNQNRFLYFVGYYDQARR